MEVINLRNNWQIAICLADMNINAIDDAEWNAVTLPFDADSVEKVTPIERIWLRCSFMMPINEECSTWWLETDQVVKGRVWVNGTLVKNPDGDAVSQLDVTNYTALDENVVVLCLEPTEALRNWEGLVCVPYPCE